MHSKQWHYSLHRDFQNCYSTRRSPTGFFSSNSSSNSTRVHHTTFQREKRPSFQERNSMHRRQRDLLEIHPCVSQDIPGNSSCSRDIPGNSSCSRDIPDIPVIHDLPAFPGNSTMLQYLQGIHPFPAFSD